MDALDLSRAEWRKSTRSGDNGECVEIATVGAHVAVRDSKHPDGPKLVFTGRAWRVFLGGLRHGEFDLA